MTNSELWIVSSMNQLLALARSMEQEAISGYVALAERMRAENRSDLADVFEALRQQEEQHLGNVDNWIGKTDTAAISPVELAEPLFDDEGAAFVAPELLNSYRAFSMAVRNEERAFVFWTYVAAHAPTPEIREAAERMAREELEHVATLRRERRRAFHDLRRSGGKRVRADIAALEQGLADRLRDRALRSSGDQAQQFLKLAEEAHKRSALILAMPFSGAAALDGAPEGVEGRLVPLCEFLLDCYLALAGQQNDDDALLRAQTAAGAVITCLHAVRESQSASLA